MTAQLVHFWRAKDYQLNRYKSTNKSKQINMNIETIRMTVQLVQRDNKMKINQQINQNYGTAGGSAFLLNPHLSDPHDKDD